MAVGGESLELLSSQISLRVQFFEVPFVELAGDGLIDVLCNRVLPEIRVLLYVSEAVDLSGARKDASVDRTEKLGVWSHKVYPTPRGSQETKSKRPWVFLLNVWPNCVAAYSPESPGPPE